jgi:glycosyltransferase involved in cell wall biosynthesis
MNGPVSRPLTIVQLVPELNVGGVEQVVLDAARGYVARGHRSIVISNGGRLVARLVEDGTIHHALPIHRKRLGTILALIPKVARVLRASGADVVHARSRVPAWIGYHAAHRAGVPFVTTVHGFYSPHFFSRIMVRGDRVIAISRAVAEYAKASLDADPSRLRLSHEGVDAARLDLGWDAARIAARRAELGVPPGAPVVGMIGRITGLKGHPVFLDGVAALRERVPDVAALVVGAPPAGKPYLETLRVQAERLGIADRVVFTGARDDVPELLQVCDVVVSCSTRPEALPRVLIEAMAAGRPVVATAHGGALDLVEDDRTGYLVQPERPDLLADALARLLALPDRGRALGAAGRERARTHFTLDRMVDETLAVYREVAAA